MQNITSKMFYCAKTRQLNLMLLQAVPVITVNWTLEVASSPVYSEKIAERCDLVFALKTHKTVMFHEFAPNLVNVHSPMQDQSFGTIYPCTSVLNQTLRVSGTFLRHTFLDLHLTY